MPVPIRKIAVTAVLALALGACAGGVDTAGQGLVSAFAQPREPAGGRAGIERVAIFTASTRAGAGQGQGVHRAGQARYQVQTVTVPPRRRTGTLDRAGILGADPRAHFTVASRRPLDPDAFRAELAAEYRARRTVSRDVLVFVHGFNTGFEEATLRLAQVVSDSGFQGLPVLFTWPSRERVLAYGGDREIATSSRDALEAFLSDVAAIADGGRVHILAHSMGTWLAMEALRQATIAGNRDLGGRLGEVMLAAPDLDIDVFRAQLQRIGTPERFTIFSASDDRALQVSSFLAGERTRLGALDLTRPENRDLVQRLGVRVIDLTRSTEVQDTTFRHGSFAEVPGVVRMIGARLNTPIPAEPAPTPAPVEAQILPAPAQAGEPEPR